MRRFFCAFALLLTLLAISVDTPAQRVYRWVDENGQVQYTQTPPPEAPANTETIDIGGQASVDAQCCSEVKRFSVEVARAMNRGLTLVDIYDTYPAHSYPHIAEVANFISSRVTGDIRPAAIGGLAENACSNGTFRACRLDGAGAAAGSETGPRASASTSGTAFQVAPNLLVTNHHVVDRCQTITVGQEEQLASIVSVDESADLALLRAPVTSGVVPPMRQSKQVVLGESVVVAGYPLGNMLGSLNVTTGAVSAEGGPRGQSQLFQLTAPIQPGSSGGPVLDQQGQLIGVVVSRMNDRYALRASGSVPQNVNFAIKPQVVARFLDHRTWPIRRTAPHRLDRPAISPAMPSATPIRWSARAKAIAQSVFGGG